MIIHAKFQSSSFKTVRGERGDRTTGIFFTRARLENLNSPLALLGGIKSVVRGDILRLWFFRCREPLYDKRWLFHLKYYFTYYSWPFIKLNYKVKISILIDWQLIVSWGTDSSNIHTPILCLRIVWTIIG